MSLKNSFIGIVVLIMLAGCTEGTRVGPGMEELIEIPVGEDFEVGFETVILTEFSVGNEVVVDFLEPNCLSWRPESMHSANVSISWNDGSTLLLSLRGFTTNDGALVNGTSPLNAVVLFDPVESTELQVSIGIPETVEPSSVDGLEVRFDYVLRGNVGEVSLQRCTFAR
jgi:hypothetical protein